MERRPPVAVDGESRTLVVAPHQDDETLGCGGTIALKRRAGARVCIAFVGDGSQSHQGLIEPERLREMREQEAREASATLGVTADALDFLRVPETRFRQHRAEAVEKLAAVIDRERPEEIYLPYRGEPLDDHVVTAEVVAEILRRQPRAVRLYEYAVWTWMTWPWVPLALGRTGWLGTLWKTSARMGFGVRILREFGHAVDVRDVLDVKRAALDKHVSQMTRPDTDESWWTLGEVAGGEFMDNFFQPRELFRVTEGGAV
jgi:LmbE family N-acetylglucosaminyl deacetylase